MKISANTLSSVACAGLVLAALLACKKNDVEEGTAEASASAQATTASPTPAPAAPPKPIPVLAVGQTGSTSDFKITLKEVKKCTPARYQKVKKENHLVGALVTLEATAGDENINASPIYAKLVDSDGHDYNNVYFAPKDCEPTLKSRQLAAGDKATGWLVFEAPIAAKGLQFQYNQRIGLKQTRFRYNIEVK